MDDKNDNITDWQVIKYDTMVKNIDQYLLASRIAIEVKARHEVFGVVPSNFNMYVDIAQEGIPYTPKKRNEILKIAESILKEKYNIMIVSKNPFKIKILKK